MFPVRLALATKRVAGTAQGQAVEATSFFFAGGCGQIGAQALGGQVRRRRDVDLSRLPYFRQKKKSIQRMTRYRCL